MEHVIFSHPFTLQPDGTAQYGCRFHEQSKLPFFECRRACDSWAFQDEGKPGYLDSLVYDTDTEPRFAPTLNLPTSLNRAFHRHCRTGLNAGTAPVWGAGTHTLRLLETSMLAQANILAFIDSNVRYHGKRLRGIEILSPEQAFTPDATVLISRTLQRMKSSGHCGRNALDQSSRLPV